LNTTVGEWEIDSFKLSLTNQGVDKLGEVRRLNFGDIALFKGLVCRRRAVRLHLPRIQVFRDDLPDLGQREYALTHTLEGQGNGVLGNHHVLRTLSNVGRPMALET
jgi:hypothetical protein